MPPPRDKDLSRQPSAPQATAGGLAVATSTAAAPIAAGTAAAQTTTGLFSGVLHTAAATAAYAALLALIMRAQRKFKAGALAALYPELRGTDLDAVAARELEFDAAFSANTRTRLRRDVDAIFADDTLAARARELAAGGADVAEIARQLDVSERQARGLLADDRASTRERMKRLLARERRYLQDHIDAAKRRMELEAAARRIEAESPEGAVWVLGKAAKHTKDCEIMAGGREDRGLLWGWDVLHQVNPANRHGGCKCELLAPAEARRRGIPFERGVMTPTMWSAVLAHAHECATIGHTQLRSPRVADLRQLGFGETAIAEQLLDAVPGPGEHARHVNVPGVGSIREHLSVSAQPARVGAPRTSSSSTRAALTELLAAARLIDPGDKLTECGRDLPGLGWLTADGDATRAITVSYRRGTVAHVEGARSWGDEVRARRDLRLLRRARPAAHQISVVVCEDGAVATTAAQLRLPAALISGLADGLAKPADTFTEAGTKTSYLGDLDPRAIDVSERDRSILEAARAIADGRSEQTLSDVGAANGVTQARVSQIVAKWNESHDGDQITLARRRRRA
jgi:hypothetical protein